MPRDVVAADDNKYRIVPRNRRGSIAAAGSVANSSTRDTASRRIRDPEEVMTADALQKIREHLSAGGAPPTQIFLKVLYCNL